MRDLTLPSRPNVFYRRVLPGDWFGSRKIAVSSAIAAALVMDTSAIIIAAVLADWHGLGLSRLDGPDLVYLVLPAYWLIAPYFRAYLPDLLGSAKGKIRLIVRPLSALGAAVIAAVLAAFAFNVANQLWVSDAPYFVANAILLITIGRAMICALVGSIGNQLSKRVAVLSDGSMDSRAFPDKVVDLRSIGWDPTQNEPEALERVFQTFSGYDRIVLALSNRDDRVTWTQVMRLTGLDAEIIEPNIADLKPIALGQWGGQPTLIVSRGPLTLPERFAKRAFDTAVTLAAAPIWVPLVGFLALLVRLDSPGPAIFIQERIGRNNCHYKCYKLRTMRRELNDGAGRRSTERDDPRVTRLGAVLRRTSLDELPQLFNVLKGEMSLVGPRPHALGSTAEGKLFWDAVPGYWYRHAMKPGITGLAQVRGYRGSTERQRHLELRVSADLEYINSWSIWLDLKIIVQTMRVIIHPNAF